MGDPSNLEFDPNNTHPGALNECLRQTEMYIADQMAFATAADQRAVAFAAVIIVVIGLFIGTDMPAKIEWAGPWVVALLMLSVSLAFYAARPTRMYGRGGSAEGLRHLCALKDPSQLVHQLCLRNDQNIASNKRVLRHSALIFRCALLCAFFASVLLLVDWLEVIRAVNDSRRMP